MLKSIITVAIIFAASTTFAATTLINNFEANKDLKISIFYENDSKFIGISVDDKRNSYAILLEEDGSLSNRNQRIYNALQKVISGELKLTQIKAYKDKEYKGVDLKHYKRIAAVEVSN